MANTVDIRTTLVPNGIPLVFNYDASVGSPFQLYPADTAQHFLVATLLINPSADGVLSLFSGTTLIRKYNVKSGISSGWNGGDMAVFPVVKAGEALNISCTVAFSGDLGLTGVAA
jgi:hypothetical protein